MLNHRFAKRKNLEATATHVSLIHSIRTKRRQLTDSDNHVEHEVRKHDPYVPPSVVEADVQRREVLVAHSVLAVLALGGGVGVVEVPAEGGDELARPFIAGLAAGWREGSELVGLADDVETTV